MESRAPEDELASLRSELALLKLRLAAYERAAHDDARALASLQASERRFRELVEHLPEPVVVHVDRTIAYANAACVAQLGMASVEALIGHSILEFATAESQALIHSRMTVPLPSGELLEVVEQSFVRLDGGGEVHAEVKSVPFVYDSRPATLSIARDITRRRAVEQESARLIATLEFERNRLRTLLQQAPAFIAVIRGPDHVYELANDEYLRLVGRTDLLGKTVIEAIPEIAGQGFLERMNDVLATGHPFIGNGMPVRLARYPGAPLEQRLINLVLQPLVEADSRRTGVFAHGVDVTDATILQQLQLRQTLELAAIGRLAGGVAHDFNNLLTVILNHAELTLEELAPTDPMHAGLLEILEAGTRAVALTKQLSAISRQVPPDEVSSAPTR